MVMYLPRNSIVNASPNLTHSLVLRSECSFREGCPRELLHSPSRSKRALNMGRVLLMTTRPLEYHISQISIAALRLNRNKIAASRYGSSSSFVFFTCRLCE